MRRGIVRAAFAAVVAVSCLPLGGCAVSLFSDHDFEEEDHDERIDALEKRMDAVEHALPPAAATPTR